MKLLKRLALVYLRWVLTTDGEAALRRRLFLVGWTPEEVERALGKIKGGWTVEAKP